MTTRMFEKRFQHLQSHYAISLQKEIAVLETSLRDFLNEESVEGCLRFWTIVHNISGTAGSYGFHDFAKVLREIELLIEPFKNVGTLPQSVREMVVLLFEDARKLIA